MEKNSQITPAQKHLVLGFDAGCLTCNELARKVEEQVGDRLKVRNLREPQLEEWRKRALGEDATWAPTLFEIKGADVRAWTGWRMGVELSRRLGPVATWRVLQVLGERADAPAVNTKAFGGMSRGQFLKGVGGAVVAMSVLSGTGKLSPTVEAMPRSSSSTGMLADQNKAKSIVRSSRQFRALLDKMRKGTLGNKHKLSFDFNQAIVKVNEELSLAGVSVPTKGQNGGVAAAFLVDMSNKVIYSYRYTVVTLIDPKKADLTLYEDDQVVGRITIEEGYITSEDSRRTSFQEFEKGIEKRQPQGQISVLSACSSCLSRTEDYCNYVLIGYCFAVGLIAWPLGIPCSVLVYYSDGCASYARTSCYQNGYCW